jgi:hypothetical protein
MVVDASKFLCMSLNFYSLNRGLVHRHWLYLKMIIQLREAGRGVTRRINFRVINFLLARASYAVTYLTNLQWVILALSHFVINASAHSLKRFANLPKLRNFFCENINEEGWVMVPGGYKGSLCKINVLFFFYIRVAVRCFFFVRGDDLKILPREPQEVCRTGINFHKKA